MRRYCPNCNIRLTREVNDARIIWTKDLAVVLEFYVVLKCPNCGWSSTEMVIKVLEVEGGD